jgi:imidazolonepropionase-like amidohydrolase
VRIAGLIWAFTLVACSSPGKGTTAYVGAHVFDGTGNVIDSAVILESQGRITTIGPAGSVDVQRGTTIVPVHGQWIIPGLIDGHAHAGESNLATYLAYGVTSVRHVGGDLDRLTSLRARVAADSIPGPRLYISGEALTGAPAVWPGQVVLKSPGDVAPAVARLAAAGVSQIKLYTHTTRELLNAVVLAAREHGVPVTAHLGRVDAFTAAQLGVHSIEHLSGIVEATVRDPSRFYAAHEQFPAGWMTFLRGWAALDSAALEKTAIALAETKVVMVPTLIQSETYARVIDTTYAQTLDLAAVSAQEQAEWNLPDLIARYAITPADLPLLARSREKEDLFLRRFAAHGGKVVAGSDSPNQLLVPGASLLEELALLVRAGFTPTEALVSATQTAAQLLNADSIGVIRPGAVADFVVLAGSPLDDITNVRRIAIVVARGHQRFPDELRRTRYSPRTSP